MRAAQRARWHGWRSRIVVGGACAAVSLLVMVAPAPAIAAEGAIDGAPLNINADDVGRLQVIFDGSAIGEFFPVSATLGAAGLHIATSTGPGEPYAVFGFLATPFFPVDNGGLTLTGDGSVASPFVLSTVYEARDPQGLPIVRINQTVTYVNGESQFLVSYKLSNQLVDQPVSLRAFAAADLYVAGSDSGVGLFVDGPPREVGGVNQDQGSSARLVEVPGSPWNAYQEDAYGTIWAIVQDTNGTGVGFGSTINPLFLDNGVGVQWGGADFNSLITVGPLADITLNVIWRFRRFNALSLEPASASLTTGAVHTVVATARDANGNPDSGRTVRYEIAGSNPGSGAVTTAADGSAAIGWTGTNAGTDTLTAYVDLNDNATRDGNEPERVATVDWTTPAPVPPAPVSPAPVSPPPPLLDRDRDGIPDILDTSDGSLPPVAGKTVTARVVSGEVFVKYPAGFRAQISAASGFVPLKGAATIPIGSTLDTLKGVVAITSAANRLGASQSSNFYSGIFAVKQRVPKGVARSARLTTDIALSGGLKSTACGPAKGASASARRPSKKVLRRLWGSGKGRFRTVGKHSAATVRGTIWLTEDRCDGTLTKVVRGRVAVRDFRLARTVTVRAGHSYLARAQRATSKLV